MAPSKSVEFIINLLDSRNIVFIIQPPLNWERMRFGLTIVVDDAGSGDLLYGVVIGAYREETSEFKYDILDVRFYQPGLFSGKEYLQESKRIVSRLVAKLTLKPEEEIHVCQGCIFDVAVQELCETYGEDKVKRVRVVGEAQRLVEIAYLDEIRNIGYEPLAEREAKRAKSFFHMMRWLRANPDMLRYAKTGWPRLKRYSLFKGSNEEDRGRYTAICSQCGQPCKVPFKPAPDRPVFCQDCWKTRKNHRSNSQPFLS